MIKKVKNTFPWTYISSDLNEEEVVGMFYEKELKKKKKNQKEFRFEKVIKRESDKVHAKWNSYNSFFNSLLIKKR